MSDGFESIRDFRLACRAVSEGWLVQQPAKELATARKILEFIQSREDSPSSDRAFLRAVGRLKDSERFKSLSLTLSEGQIDATTEPV